VPSIEPRSLNADEERVLRLLLNAWPDGTEFASQIPSLVVTGRCDCDCATVDFAVDTNVPEERSRVLPVQADLTSKDGESIGGVLLFERGGQLSALEAFSYLDDPITSWPPNEHIAVRLR
jgi:hypothetical protein